MHKNLTALSLFVALTTAIVSSVYGVSGAWAMVAGTIERRVQCADMTGLKWLFLDLNSYFASVEQQEDARLRGRPVAIVPALTSGTTVIAASYEARAFGVRTGHKLGEAQRLCPPLIAVPARHDIYVAYHHRIRAVIEQHIHIEKICSIDETACALIGRDAKPEAAYALARRVQGAILSQVGECLGSSIGLAPSRLLAKTASNMKKPRGITMIRQETLPTPLFSLRLHDLTGIGRNRERRLNAAGIHDVASFWNLTPGRARKVWGSIEGERFWYGLHGVDILEAPQSPSKSIGHSQVLAPQAQHPSAAWSIGRRLLVSAAARLRNAGSLATNMQLSARIGIAGYWEGERNFQATANTFALLRSLDDMHSAFMSENEGEAIRKISVTLCGLIQACNASPDLFGLSLIDHERSDEFYLSCAIDRLNQRYGRGSVSIGPPLAHIAPYSGGKIAFSRIPDQADFLN